MRKFFFEEKGRDKKSNARVGVIYTPHGKIETPAFVPVGTQATVKSLTNQELEEIGVQVFFVNTYHLYLRPGVEAIKKFGGIHKFCAWKKPLISDSGGFQVFSLGRQNSRFQKVLAGGEQELPLVKIEEEGVVFKSHLDGSEHVFTPEKSIQIQAALGTDLAVAFDECTFYPASWDYSLSAMERTHRWAVRCLQEFEKIRGKTQQALYGVIQGGVYQDLRQKSAEFIANLPFAGVAIGGVSVGESKEEMRNVLDWVMPFLPPEKPRHLLGVGEIDDIFDLVEKGIDSFDCVMPTRLGRMGHVLVHSQKKNKKAWEVIDITKSIFAEEKTPLDRECSCFVCQNYSAGYIHHLFRTRELLGYRLATFHNLYFIENLVKEIRKAIEKGTFMEVRKKWLGD